MEKISNSLNYAAQSTMQNNGLPTNKAPNEHEHAQCTLHNNDLQTNKAHNERVQCIPSIREFARYIPPETDKMRKIRLITGSSDSRSNWLEPKWQRRNELVGWPVLAEPVQPSRPRIRHPQAGATRFRNKGTKKCGSTSKWTKHQVTDEAMNAENPPDNWIG